MKFRGRQHAAARGGGAQTVAPPLSPVQRTLARGLEHHQAGRLADAEALYRQVLAAEPAHADALNLLGLLANQCGQHAAAVELISQAVRIQPLAPQYHNSLGVSYQRLDRFEEAVGCYDRALALQPGLVDALSNRGAALHMLGRLEEALASFERALKLRPNSHETLSHIGALLSDLGRLDEAEIRLRRALKLQPAYPDALIALGSLLVARRQLVEALELAERAVAVSPNDPRTHDLRGTALRWAGRLDDAIVSYERALAIYPNAAGGWRNLAGALQVSGRTADATAAFRQSLTLDPTSPTAHSSLIFTLDLTPGAADERQAERQRWNERFGQAWRQRPPTYTNTRDAARPLRVGYVSADFCNHSAATVFMPILRAHDRSQVRIYCYSGTPLPDAITAEARALADVWHDVAFLSDDQLEARIKADEIDVLVDLSGHTTGNRLPVFARKPAPVQVTGWGYATGTGLDAIDGFLVDRVAAPPADDHLYAERIVPIPSTVCFEPPAGTPAVNALPALSRGYVTFGAFNRLPKVSAATRAVWALVMRAVPTARLLVKTGAHDSPGACQQLVDDLVAHGVERERIELRGGSPRLEHLAAHNDVDLLLDSFPHVGGVTTVEALLMGVPVVTLLGDGVAGRLSASFLTALDLSELVATTTDEYVTIAQQASSRLAWLAEQRTSLRERLLASPIANAPAYTRAVEAAYRELWQQWCAEDPTAQARREDLHIPPWPMLGANIDCVNIPCIPTAPPAPLFPEQRGPSASRDPRVGAERGEQSSHDPSPTTLDPARSLRA